MNEINIAVLGAGYWGTKVIREYQAIAQHNPQVSLASVCDVNEAALTRFTDLPVTTDYDQILMSEDIDAIHICTPTETHYAIGKTALEQHKHVLLEKPIALKAKHAYDLVELAKTNHTILQVGHIFRFNNALTRIKALITNRFFGDIYYLKLQWTTLVQPPLERDIIYDLGPHPIDISCYLLDRWPIKAYCHASAFRKALFDEVAYITLEYENLVLAHTELSWLQPGKVRAVNIMGSERCADIDCLRQSIQIHETTTDSSHPLNVTPNNTIRDEIHHFITSINCGVNSNNSGLVGAKNVAILESLKQSLAEERVIHLRY